MLVFVSVAHDSLYLEILSAVQAYPQNQSTGGVSYVLTVEHTCRDRFASCCIVGKLSTALGRAAT